MQFHDEGLSSEKVKELIAQYGPNELPEGKSKGLFLVFISQFTSPLILILIVSAAIIFFMGELWDALIIAFILVFNAVIGTFQEGKADNALKALKKLVEGSATVLRDGKVTILSDKEIVPGDIILLQEGERVPADARLLNVQALKIDESSLTGESVPVEKSLDEPAGVAGIIQDRTNIVFKGTVVVGGSGKAVVIATGLLTAIGKISKDVASIDTDVPLKRGIERLSKILLAAVLVISVFIMVFGLSRGESFRDMFATVVSLAVSIVPEGLPVVMTLVLASGVWRMAKRQVLVKKLEAVEALGQAKIIAVDKTGTLTENEMVLQKVYVDGKTYDVGGSGYEPKGDFSLGGAHVDPLNHPDLLFAGRIASFCAEAKVVYIEESKLWKVAGDPTEAAMIVFAEKIGFEESAEEFEKIFEIPFDYVTKYRLSIRKFEKKNFLSIIGAPEKVLEMCSRVRREQKSEKLGDEERREIEKVFTGLSEQGYRVVALAANPDADESVDPKKIEHLTFVGFFGMRDPLRKEVNEAVRRAQAAGIRVMMITGDHKVTAHAIAFEAGIAHAKEDIVTGEDLENLSDEELIRRFKDVNVFARVTPDHKMRIIELFRKRGEVVAMTGDGVNDAPSLAAADLGVAMGIKGTEVAKEASDIILLDDNFGSIISAVEEGRSIYRTIRKVILYLFSTSIAEAFVIIGALIAGFPLPILPAQIIWLNFVTDGFLVLALAAEPKEKGLLDKGFKQGKSIVDSFALKRMMFMGIVIAIGTLAIFAYYLNGELAKALTISLSALAIFQWFNAWNCKSETESVFSKSFFNNWYLIFATLAVAGLQVLAVYHPFFQKILHTVPLNIADWLWVLGVAATIVVLEEIRKKFQK